MSKTRRQQNILNHESPGGTFSAPRTGDEAEGRLTGGSHLCKMQAASAADEEARVSTLQKLSYPSPPAAEKGKQMLTHKTRQPSSESGRERHTTRSSNCVLTGTLTGFTDKQGNIFTKGSIRELNRKGAREQPETVGRKHTCSKR